MGAWALLASVDWLEKAGGVKGSDSRLKARSECATKSRLTTPGGVCPTSSTADLARPERVFSSEAAASGRHKKAIASSDFPSVACTDRWLLTALEAFKSEILMGACLGCA